MEMVDVKAEAMAGSGAHEALPESEGTSHVKNGARGRPTTSEMPVNHANRMRKNFMFQV